MANTIPTTPQDAQHQINHARVRFDVTKRAIDRLRRQYSDFGERQSQDLISHIATIDRWVIGYGAGIAYLSIEGVGFINDIELGYRLIVGGFVLAALLCIGVEKVARREALRKSHEKCKEAHQEIQCVYDSIRDCEVELDAVERQAVPQDEILNQSEWMQSKIDDVLAIEKGLEETLKDWDEGIPPDSIVVEEMMPILKKRMDMWALVLLGHATFILVVGVFHLLIVGGPPPDVPIPGVAS